MTYKLQLALGPFVFLVSCGQQPRTGLARLSGITDSHQQEIGIMFHNETREECVELDDPPGCPPIVL